MDEQTIDPESRWFKIVVLIATGFFAGFFIANAIYFNRIMNGSCSAVTKTEATVLFWANIILAIIAGIIFIWVLFRIVWVRRPSKEEKTAAEKTTSEKKSVLVATSRTPAAVRVSPATSEELRGVTGEFR